MKKIIFGIWVWTAGFAFGSAGAPDAGKADAAVPASEGVGIGEKGWPKEFSAEGVKFTVYQPQVDSWDGVNFAARSAVGILPEGEKTATYGVVVFGAETLVDKGTREVAFEGMVLKEVNIPSASGADAAKWAGLLRSFVPREVKGISLDRLESAAAVSDAVKKGNAGALRNDPPLILFFEKPALLLLVDGEEKWVEVPGTGAKRLINTRALVVRSSDGMVYLHFWDGYVKARNLAGPWSVSEVTPHDVLKAEKAAVDAKTVDLLGGQPNPQTKEKPSLEKNALPLFVFATKPTELVVTEGAPKWVPIAGTNLLFVENTTAHVFRDIEDSKVYVLLSGRWFRAGDFNGPWSFVKGGELPGDFAKIPDDSPQENVKASVPGTKQAKEALVANMIPQTSQVERKAKITPAPVFDGGTEKLAAIEGTPLFYAVNTSTPVIKVDDKTWFACQNGVWFSAVSATGPWVVSVEVPAVIYTIPVGSPLHYVTYVRVYRYDATYVWVGYTPGYYGTVVSADGVVVFGTGYAYPVYVSDTVYVSYPVTYGYSTNLCWSPWAGWAFGFAVGWAWGSDWGYWGPCPPAPYWGPYWPAAYGWGYNPYGGITAWGPYGWAGTSGNIYRQSGPWSSVSRVRGGYDAWTGNEWAQQYGHAYNSVTGTRVAGQRGAVANVYTGDYAYGGRGVAHNDRSGVTAWGAHGTVGNADTGRQISGGHETVVNPSGQVTHIAGAHGNEGNAVLDVNGNVYAGHDGHVYQRNDDGSWNQLTKPSNQLGGGGSGERWNSGGRGQERNLGGGGAGERWGSRSGDPQGFENWNQQRDELNRQFEGRNWGAQRERSFQGLRGGGGFGGGGFRRR